MPVGSRKALGQTLLSLDSDGFCMNDRIYTKAVPSQLSSFCIRETECGPGSGAVTFERYHHAGAAARYLYTVLSTIVLSNCSTIHPPLYQGGGWIENVNGSLRTEMQLPCPGSSFGSHPQTWSLYTNHTNGCGRFLVKYGEAGLTSLPSKAALTPEKVRLPKEQVGCWSEHDPRLLTGEVNRGRTMYRPNHPGFFTGDAGGHLHLGDGRLRGRGDQG